MRKLLVFNKHIHRNYENLTGIGGGFCLELQRGQVIIYKKKKKKNIG